MTTKREQVDAVAAAASITHAQARMAVDAIAATIIAALVERGRFSYHGLGTFNVQHRGSRRINNPSTGLIMDLPPSTTVRFRPAKELRERVEGR